MSSTEPLDLGPGTCPVLGPPGCLRAAAGTPSSERAGSASAAATPVPPPASPAEERGGTGAAGDGASSGGPPLPDDPVHEPMHLITAALDAGCSLLQSRGPVGKIHQHVCAFHMYSHDATRPVRAHHYCAHRGEEMRQCVLYDSSEPNARLIGLEYIISRRLYESLPPEERRYWHSHVYEVKSGMLVAPGVPGPAEDADMRQVINTYGKIWHTWQVDRGDPLPLGPPQLMMAYTADGQLPPDVLASRDRAMGVDSQQVRHRRRHMAADPPEPHPDADHPWRTGRAWQCVMQEVDFRRPPPPPAAASSAPSSAPALGSGSAPPGAAASVAQGAETGQGGSGGAMQGEEGPGPLGGDRGVMVGGALPLPTGGAGEAMDSLRPGGGGESGGAAAGGPAGEGQA
ncbi:hypothetical protein HYH03_010198 [Edaphochlamys debaryana]|uniref:DUF1264-domain-containing protein n=1 Tax=Edaphochlamys debaryana TaxID=47281 RepID=A0A835XXF2_9CHLO|nr:hypothetical protein HYH03_010198 [Edaphochlamys debaryana]|eukprot:KAG2491407.1 hypothetical protein HYH03_010198 [Edaphochlamys debaryana]